MTTLVHGIEAAPSFPRTDISADTMTMLELMLANEDIVAQGHQASESISWMLKVGHPTTVRVSERVFEPRQVEAIDYGVTLFETMNSLVAASLEADGMFVVNANAVKLTQHTEPATLFARAERALQTIREDLPHASEAITAAATRHYRHLTEYALLGAALERQFILETNTAQ